MATQLRADLARNGTYGLRETGPVQRAARGVVDDEEKPRQERADDEEQPRRKRKKLKTSSEQAAAAIAQSGLETFLRLGAVLLATGLNRSQVYVLMAEDRFPKPVKIGKLCFWAASEIVEWQRAEMAARGALVEPVPLALGRRARTASAPGDSKSV